MNARIWRFIKAPTKVLLNSFCCICACRQLYFLSRLLNYAFNELGLRVIITGAYGPNKASQRCLEKTGHKPIAVYPGIRLIDGKYEDAIWYMLKREEWWPVWQKYQKQF